MALGKMIPAEDPEDIRTGYAGAVWDICKMSTLIGAAIAFASGIALKGRLMMLGAESWGSAAFAVLALLAALFVGLWFVVREIVGLVRLRDAHPKAADVPDARIAGWVLSLYAVAFTSTFLFTVTVDYTAEALRGLALGEYLLDFPAALIFFYAAFPSVVVNIAWASRVRSRVRALPQED